MNIKKSYLLTSLILLFYFLTNAQQAWLSTDGSYFQEVELEEVKKSESSITINLDKTFQTVKGFGGSFNELGYIALQNTTEEKKDEVMNALFGEEGLRFNNCRMPIGANDFSKEWYSFSNVMGDFEMKHFDISRDTLYQVPYIRSAMRVNPNLRIWASPWSPPIWMKRNRHYGGQATNMYWGKLYGNNMEEIYANNRFVMEPEYLNAYALYFSKFLSAYKEMGIAIDAVHPQNEVVANQLFPSCVWSPEDLATFTGDYLTPQLQKDHPEVNVWFGTMNGDSIEYMNRFIEKYPDVYGIGVQWNGIDMLDSLSTTYPNYEYMQTESECNNGLNEWFTAEHTFKLLYNSFKGGVSHYMYWNMILDDLGLSNWMWRQNSLISVDRFSGEVTYNPEYYVMRHFSSFVDEGAKRVSLENVPDELRALAFKNPTGSLIVIAQNPTDEVISTKIKSSKKRTSSLKIAAHSMVTIVF